MQPGENAGAAQPEHVRVPHTQGPTQGRQASRVRKKERNKERIFIHRFQAINIKQYDSSMYIIHTVEYFVFPRGKVPVPYTCTVHHGGVLERPTRGYVC